MYREEPQQEDWQDPMSVPLAIIFSSKNPVSDPVLEYEIRTNPSFIAAPDSEILLVVCRENSHILFKALKTDHMRLAETCPAYEYFASGFVTLQTLLDYSKIETGCCCSGLRFPHTLLCHFHSLSPTY